MSAHEATQGTPQPQTTAEGWANMTPTQPSHASFHAAYGRSLRYKIIDDRVPVDVMSDPGGASTRPTAAEALRTLACEADAVVQGVVTSAASFPVESGTFLFTDYTLTVTDVLRSHGDVVVPVGSDIVVTRPGGRVVVGGRSLEAKINTVPMLDEQRPYILFLRHLSNTGTYLSPVGLPAFSILDMARALGNRPLTADVRLGQVGLPPGQLRQIVRGASCGLRIGRISVVCST